MFRACLEESLHKNFEFLAYIRFIRNESLASNDPNHKDVLFGVKGHPCHVRGPDMEAKVFFATVNPIQARIQKCVFQYAATVPLSNASGFRTGHLSGAQDRERTAAMEIL